MPTCRSIASMSVAACTVLAIAAFARAADFRVDSKVFVGKETEPHSTNVTLFHGPHVYDFLDTPRQVALYDLARGRVVLVDPQRGVKTEVSQGMLDAFCNNLRREKLQSADPVLGFALRPEFDERSEKTASSRTFASKYITYRVKTQLAEVAGMAARYHEFGDISARLNAYVNRGSLPPFPRLAVNAALEQSAQLPAEVHLTVSSGQLLGGRTVVLRSEHVYRPRLLDSDLRMIDEAGQQLAQAEAVVLGEYLRPRVNPDE